MFTPVPFNATDGAGLLTRTPRRPRGRRTQAGSAALPAPVLGTRQGGLGIPPPPLGPLHLPGHVSDSDQAAPADSDPDPDSDSPVR